MRERFELVAELRVRVGVVVGGGLEDETSSSGIEDSRAAGISTVNSGRILESSSLDSTN